MRKRHAKKQSTEETQQPQPEKAKAVGMTSTHVEITVHKQPQEETFAEWYDKEFRDELASPEQ